MTLRNYTNTSVQTTLTVGIDAIETSITVTDATGYPVAPFAIVIDPDVVASEEVLLVTAAAGPIFTVTRAYDGTTGTAHSAGAHIIHAAIAADFVDGQVAGADTQMQYNNAGTFAGAPSLTYDPAIDTTLFQGQANHNASLGPELLANPTLEFNADGWAGAGWDWAPFTFTHDPGFTDVLETDAVLANSGDYILLVFTTGNATQGVLDIIVAPPGSGAGSADGHALLTTNASHVLALPCSSDGSVLRIDPRPAGATDTWDGQLYGPLSATRITFSDPIVLSRRADTTDASLRIHLADLSCVLMGWLTGRGMGPAAPDNLALGSGAMEAAWLAAANIAVGPDALRFGANATGNVAIGSAAMRRAQEAQDCVAIGQFALRTAYQTTTSIAIGGRAFEALVTGSENIAIGVSAGETVTSGDGNVLIGALAGSDLTDASYKLRMSHYIAPVPLIAGDFQAQTLTIGGDLDFSADTQGPILIDRTTATRYRLYVNAGVLLIEAV